MNIPQAVIKIETHLKTLADARPIRVHWENTSFTDDGRTYLRTKIIPTGEEPELTGGDHPKGIYQVSVVFPAGSFGQGNPQGLGTPLAIAQSIVDHFSRKNLGGVSIFVPRIGPVVREDEDWRSIPVSINFITL